MGAGSFSFWPGSPGLGGTTVPIAVYKNVEGDLLTLPNVICLSVSYTEGDSPATARFAYVSDDRATAMGWPTRFEQLWPLRTIDSNDVGPYVVLPDDRICVYANFPDGSYQVLFDGYARMPQANVDGGGQHVVTFGAVDAAIRCYDIPIQGRIQRNGSKDAIDDTTGAEDVPTNLPTRFNPIVGDSGNPSGQPNCTPDEKDTDPDGDGPGVAYPVFLDERIDRPTDPDHAPRLWTLSGAVRYILGVHNPQGSPPPEDEDDPEAFTFDAIVLNPDFTDLDNLLDNRRPKDDTGFFNPDDPGSYTASPVVIRDFDATNMAWPEALARLLGYHGFGMRWVLAMDGDGAPVHTFEVYRKDAGNTITPKQLYLPPQGTPLEPGSANVGTLAAAFDYHSVANSFIVETHPNRYEISVILAPLFEVGGADDAKASGNRKTFLRSNLDTADDATRRKYRWYGVDELGDGFWSFEDGETVEGEAFAFDDLWPDGEDPDTGEDVKGYVTRLRPGIRDCLTDDGKGDVYKAQLAISRNYSGDYPAFWDGTGDWQPIEGDWRLLEDRLGIEFTADDPEAIHIGKASAPTSIQNAGSILKGITSVVSPGKDGNGKPSKSNGAFFLRLTCTIEADQTLEAAAGKRLASPMGNEIRRRIDAKDHFRKDTIHLSSAFHSEQVRANPDTPTDEDGNLLPRDDTQAAQDHAAQLRSAHEFPSCPMAVTIPALSLSYQVGDRIDFIAGRDVPLVQNAGSEMQEGEAVPFVVAVTFSFEGDQQITVLQLSDRRMEPQPLEQRRGPQGNR